MWKFLFIFIVVLGTSFAAQPYRYALANEVEEYQSIAQVPQVFKTEIVGRPLKEQYIRHFLSIIHSHAKGRYGLTSEGLKIYQDNEIFRRRLAQRERILKYDKNFDASVTYDEIANPYAFLLKRLDTQVSKENRLKKLMKYDVNQDKVLSYEELSSLSRGELKGIELGFVVTKGRAILELDSNQDGTLTVNELTAMAQNAFQLFDQDSDGKISAEEYKELWRYNK